MNAPSSRDGENGSTNPPPSPNPPTWPTPAPTINPTEKEHP